MHKIVQPEGWPRPKGYANGVIALGRMFFVAGQVGWNAAGTFEGDDLVDQTRQALKNVVAVLREAGAGPEHIVRMTWYLLDKDDYLARLGRVGFVEASIEPTRRYRFADLEGSTCGAEAVAALSPEEREKLDGRIMGAFIRAKKPERSAS